MDAHLDALKLEILKSIDASLKEILSLSRQRKAATNPAAASDTELDSQYGDPAIRAKSPKNWTGPDMLGRRFSECPPEYLDLLAARFDFFNTKETDEKKRGYNARDAARARGWAARLRGGWTAPKSAGDWAEEDKPTW